MKKVSSGEAMKIEKGKAHKILTFQSCQASTGSLTSLRGRPSDISVGEKQSDESCSDSLPWRGNLYMVFDWNIAGNRVEEAEQRVEDRIP